MTNFKKIKRIGLERAKANDACESEIAKLIASKNLVELCQIIKSNFSWCYNHNVVTAELLEQFKDEFAENEIYVNTDTDRGYVLLSGNSSARLSGNSSARLFDNSSAELFDNSSAELSGNSYVNCKSTIDCKISDHAIIRRYDTNTIQYCDETMKFEKIESENN